MRLIPALIVLAALAPFGVAQQPAVPSGEITASASQSNPTANDGIARALAACPAPGGCVIVADPAYKGAEFLPVPRFDRSIALDLRHGASIRKIHDLSVNTPDAVNTEYWLDKYLDGQPIAPGKGGGYAVNGEWIKMQSTAPGFSLGNVPVGAQGWTGSKLLHLTGDFFGYGINQGIELTMESRGIGDKAGFYLYNFCYGGMRAASDEACEGFAMNMGEGPAQYRATITGTADLHPGATRIKTFSDPGKGEDPRNQGDGRAWVEDAPLAKVTVASVETPALEDIPTTLHLALSQPLPSALVSTAWATLSANVAVPQPVNSGDTTPMTFDVALLGGHFTAAPGDTLCFGGQFHEQAAITRADATHLTALLRHSHPKGSWVTQGGAACSVIDFDANRIPFHSDEHGDSKIFDYPIDVIGATTPTTLLVEQFATGRAIRGIIPGNIVFGSAEVNPRHATLANHRGTLTLPVDDAVMRQNLALFNQPVVTITGASTLSFNGICKNFRYTQPGIATCTGDPAHDGDTDRANIRIAVGSTPYGNTTATLHRAAEIVDVRNPDLIHSDPGNIVDGTLTLEANHLLNRPGSTGHIPHDYAAGVHPIQSIGYLYDPYFSEASQPGVYVGLVGAGIRGDPGLNPNGQAGYKVRNFAPPATYLGLGGTANPPDAFIAQGIFKNMFNADSSPYPSGSVGVSFGCPPEPPFDCSDQVYNYAPNQYTGFQGSLRDTWTPYTDEFLRTVSRSGFTSTYKQTPQGFAFDAPITATAVATPLYTPASSSADCPKDNHGAQVVGAIWGDGNYLYQCVAPNKIKRTAQLSTF